MQVEDSLNYVLSDHAKEELKKPGRQQIKSEWIERALSYPDHSDEDSRTNTLRVWKRIPEYGNRALRVVYSPDTQPVFVVTVFFDRGFKR
jgi:hypothetical protein